MVRWPAQTGNLHVAVWDFGEPDGAAMYVGLARKSADDGDDDGGDAGGAAGGGMPLNAFERPFTRLALDALWSAAPLPADPAAEA